MCLHKGSFCLHQLLCRHLGDVNHAPSLVAGFVGLKFFVLGDGFHVPFYCEDSFPSLSFSFSSSSGGSHQFLGLLVVFLVHILTSRNWWQVTMFLAAVWCHFSRGWEGQNSLCPSELSSEVYFGQLCWVLSLVREVRLPVGTVHSRFKKA